MIDQWWDFAYTAGDAIKQAGLDEQGCDYIPVPVTIDGRDNQWHNAGGAFNASTGLAVTTSCDDVDAAMKFVMIFLIRISTISDTGVSRVLTMK